MAVSEPTIHEGSDNRVAERMRTTSRSYCCKRLVNYAGDAPTLGLLDTCSEQQLRQVGFTTVGYGLVRTSKRAGHMGS